METLTRILTRSLAVAAVAAPLIMRMPGGSAQEVKRDPKAQAFLDSVVSAYRAMTTYQAKVSFKATLSNPELAQDAQPQSMQIKAQKPNRLALTYAEKGIDGKVVRHQIVSDGTTVFRWRSDLNTYTRTKAGATFPVLPSNLRLPDLDILIRGTDPFKDMPVPFTLGAPAKVGGIDVDVVEARVSQAGVQGTANVRLTFGQKDRAARSVLFEGQGKNPRDGKDISFRLEAIYEQVSIGQPIAPAEFTFSVPPGAKIEQSPEKRPGD